LILDHGGNNSVPGLRIRLGKRSATWLYYSETGSGKVEAKGGTRKIVSEWLGAFPQVDTAAARKLALQKAAEHVDGRGKPGTHSALKVKGALDDYIAHLKKVAAKRGKPPRWAKNVEYLKKHLAQFEHHTLADLSDMPREVMQWHTKVTEKHGPVTANQAAKVLRACYRRAARLDRSLPAALPTSAVEYNEETRSQDALAFGDFVKWRKAWEAIESPTRKAFQKINLLCGARPGELARLKWVDVLPRERRFMIRNAKARADIAVLLSVPIARELRRARDAARADGVESEYVFAARAGGHIVKTDCDGLPAHGMMFRRTWRTIAADIGVDELIAHFLLGHRPLGISPGYVAKRLLESGGAMRKGQRDVSRRIETLLAGRK
jgi:integrase